MCGISGYIGENTDNKEGIIAQMTDAIAHRGPDDQGFFVDKFVGLGMRRLAIIDLKSGQQPITSKDGKLLIFFNGEIYNYKELREELVKKGFQFKTNSDTETILHMYEAYGEEMLARLRGMFTFSIYNTETKNLFIARDFFGIKPLYYLTDGEKITAFSSEIKSFLKIPGFKAKVNNSAVLNYLSFQYNPLQETFFEGIYKLLPGHFLKIDTQTGTAVIKKYWSFEFAPNERKTDERVEEEIKSVMKNSVEHHMIADVPVGAFLSGGIDSSIITTLMQEIRGDKKIKTFTVGFDTLTEGKEAVETSSFLGTDHTEIKVGPEEYFESLKKIIWHFDEPVADPSAVGLYFLAKEARKHVKVVLSGEGADELFGGYNIYLAPIASRRMAWLPISIINLFLNIPFKYFGKNYLKRVNTKLEDWYIGNASVFGKQEIDGLWKGKKEKPLSLIPLYKNVAGLSDSTKMQYIDINTWLIGDILAKADKMTMANSLELRVPFLDVWVAKVASTLSDKMKWRGGVTKYALRQAFKNIIPESTRNRRKLGFPTPVRDWLTSERKDVYETILKNDYIKKNMNLEIIKNLIDKHTSKQEDNSRKIYLLLMLSLWYNVYIKEN